MNETALEKGKRLQTLIIRCNHRLAIKDGYMDCSSQKCRWLQSLFDGISYGRDEGTLELPSEPIDMAVAEMERILQVKLEELETEFEKL